MLWIDRLEKLGRLLLWLSIASAFVVVPVGFARQRQGESELREALQKAEAQLREALKPKKSARLTYESMGGLLMLEESKAAGHVWFTNVSARAGVVCVVGAARNPTTQKIVTSLPTCQDVAPYASAVHIAMMFAGRNLADVCGKGACDFHVVDVPQSEAEKLADNSPGLPPAAPGLRLAK